REVKVARLAHPPREEYLQNPRVKVLVNRAKLLVIDVVRNVVEVPSKVPVHCADPVDEVRVDASHGAAALQSFHDLPAEHRILLHKEAVSGRIPVDAVVDTHDAFAGTVAACQVHGRG